MRQLTYSSAISGLCRKFTKGLGVLSKIKDLAAGAMKSVSGQFANASRAIADLAASLANRAAAAADLGRILDIIETVPGVSFDKPELDADYLNTLLAAVQMGELTLAVHYRQQTEASVVRLHPIATAEANAVADSDNKFSSKILVDGESDKPAIQMLMNTEHLAKNYRHVSADTLINALAFPIENVKGGFIIAKPFRAIARPIAGWLLNIIFNQGEKLHRRFLANRGEDQPQLPSPPADEEQAVAPRASSTSEGGDVEARGSDRTIGDQPRNIGDQPRNDGAN
jgi:hypothetical protein